MKAKEKLRAYWSKREDDIMLYWPSRQSDGHWLSGIFNDEFIKQIKARDFDITTMKFEVSPLNTADDTTRRKPTPQDSESGA
jgi:hypothetical protein